MANKELPESKPLNDVVGAVVFNDATGEIYDGADGVAIDGYREEATAMTDDLREEEPAAETQPLSVASTKAQLKAAKAAERAAQRAKLDEQAAQAKAEQAQKDAEHEAWLNQPAMTNGEFIAWKNKIATRVIAIVAAAATLGGSIAISYDAGKQTGFEQGVQNAQASGQISSDIAPHSNIVIYPESPDDNTPR